MAAKEQTVAEPHALSDALEHNNNKILDSFTVELAQSLTGDSQVERTLTRLLQISSFIDKNGGAYYQVRRYYRSLPEAEILASPELMSGMSILCSLTFDMDGSEK